MQHYKFFINSKYLEKKLETMKNNCNLFFKLRKQNKYNYYFNIPLAFDIETTNYIDYDNNIKEAYMYIWQVGIFDISVYGRTWEEFILFMNYLKRTISEYNINDDTRVIMWVANLGFEFQFMRKHFNITEMFAKEERHPISFLCNDFFEFRDALALSGGSLDFLAKTYTKTQKLIDTLNYKLMRNSKTVLHMNEYAYCTNDVIILCEFARKMYDEWCFDFHYLPLTKTGVLRYDVKQQAKLQYKLSTLKDYIKNLFPTTKQEYLFIMEYLFRGGYTHALSFLVELVIQNEDMRGIDFGSSYPSVMLKCYVPKSKFKDVKCDNEKDLQTLCRKNCTIFIADFYNIKAKYGYTIESKNRIIKFSSDSIFDNGRLYSSSHIRVFLTELDYYNYKMFYSYDKMKINKCMIAKKGFLPKYLINPMINAYIEKTKLKNEGLNDTQEYAIKKGYVNSSYGLTVTRLVFNDISYENEEWKIKESDRNYDEQISNQILSPFFGIYITAQARHKELLTLYKMRGDVIYSDTDSHKLMNYEKNKKYITKYNNKQLRLNMKYAIENNIDFNLIKDLGLFSDEGQIKKFKTLGTKRYCYEDKKGIHTVVSGGNKKSIINYSKMMDKDVFDIFSNNLTIPKEYSQKITTHYNDSTTEREIIDFEGNSEIMHEESSVALYDIPFSMKLDKDFKCFLEMIEERGLRYGKYKIY